jgi:hypothetical protein
MEKKVFTYDKKLSYIKSTLIVAMAVSLLFAIIFLCNENVRFVGFIFVATGGISLSSLAYTFVYEDEEKKKSYKFIVLLIAIFVSICFLVFSILGFIFSL